MKDDKWLGVAAVISAGVASLCCIGPAVFIALGLSSLDVFAAFEQYRPLFMGLVSAILGTAFYFTYRKHEVACADGSCKMAGGSPKAKATLWVITIVAAAFMSAPYWLTALNDSDKSSAVQLPPGTYHTVMLNVEGMTCNACAVAIKNSVKKVSGVYSARIDFDNQMATVITDGKTDAQEVLKAIAAAGYKADLLAGGNNARSR